MQVLFQKLKVCLTSAVMCQPTPATPPGCNSQQRVTAPFPNLSGSSVPAKGSGKQPPLSLWELRKALGHPHLPNNVLLKVRQALKQCPGLSVEVFIKCIFSCVKLTQNLTGAAVFILLHTEAYNTGWLVSSCPVRRTQPESALVSQQL